MKLARLAGAICLMCSCNGRTLAQELNPPSNSSTKPDANPALKHRAAESPQTLKPNVRENIDLTVPKGAAAFAAFGHCDGCSWGQPVALLQLRRTRDRSCF